MYNRYIKMNKNSYIPRFLRTLDLLLIRYYTSFHSDSSITHAEKPKQDYYGVLGSRSANVRGDVPKTVFFYYDYKLKQITHSR